MKPGHPYEHTMMQIDILIVELELEWCDVIL